MGCAVYHEVTYKQIKHRRIRRLAFVAVAAIVAVGLVFAFMAMRASAREQGVVSTREAIMNAAKQCCAVEGSYPSSIKHLEEHYGLVVNRDDYIISYEWFADNVMPSVAVTAR